jgi:hypothetical protein
MYFRLRRSQLQEIGQDGESLHQLLRRWYEVSGGPALYLLHIMLDKYCRKKLQFWMNDLFGDIQC